MTIDRLSSLDRIMLAVSDRWPQDIAALAFFEGGKLLDPSGELRIEDLRRAIAARLHYVPRLRQLIYSPRRGLGAPLWVDDPTFDLSEHVLARSVPPLGGDTELLDTVEDLRRQPLDPTRPRWEMWFLPGLSEGRVGMFVRIHHSIADGMAVMASVAAFLDADPDAPMPSPPPWTPRPWPSARELLADNLQHRAIRLKTPVSSLMHPAATARRLRDSWPAVRELLDQEPATRTSIDRMVGPKRNVALIRTDLTAVKDAGHPRDATVNDVLLTVTAGGLRAVLLERGEPIGETTLLSYVPVSLRTQGDGPQQGNLIAQMIVPLPLAEPDPTRRLGQIASGTVRRKTRAHTSLAVLMRSRIMRSLMLKAAMSRRVNVTTASIPGPPLPLYLAGARMLEVFPVIPLIADEPLGVGALSYAGNLYIGINADGDTFPDLDVVTSGVRRELEALQSRTLSPSRSEGTGP